MADTYQLVDLMHGEINLKSELGHGTITTFWIPFNKPQFNKLRSPPTDARPVLEKSRSDKSIPGCLSATQSVAGDFSHYPAPSSYPSSRSNTDLDPMLPKEDSTEEPVEQEIDRKNVHVLIVEDKYVAIHSRMCYSVLMYPIAELLTSLWQCYKPADRSQDRRKVRVLCECGVEWQRSS